MELKRARLLYKLISENQRLASRRHPMFDRNMAMKVFGYLFVAFWAVYLFVLGIAFFGIFDGTNREAFDWINGGMLFFLVLDFLLRFGMQETPAQDIKPYKLMPIPTRFLINVFLIRIGTRMYNLFWFFFLVPFSVLAVPKFYGWIGVAGFLLGWWLMYVLNSYWYLFWRTFVNRNILYVFIPIAIYALVIYFGYFFEAGGMWCFYATLYLGRGFVSLNLLSFLLPVVLSALMFFINRAIQERSLYREIARVEKVSHVKSVEMSFLNRFGEIGEYMKLEIKSTMRNKVVRGQFLSGVFYMLLLSALFSFTDVYDSMPFMRIFICVYCFSCLGVVILTSVMCAEGNYIDGLMSRKESVLSLLKAKYYFNCIMLIIPLLFAVIPVMKGKLTFLDVLGCLFFSTGVVFPFLFQLAVYNKNTLHLNEKLTKSGRGTKAQLIVSSVAMFLPMIIMYVLMVVFTEDISATIMLALGLAGTLCSPIWLRNVYKRFMACRYEIMDGFRNSRN